MQKSVITSDGSKTLYSEKYQQNFHDDQTGALKESLTKHVIPAFTYHKDKSHFRILDICFGLGYNTLATLYYLQKESLDFTLEVFSPELDGELVKSLLNFEYPPEFKTLLPIIRELACKHYYKDETLEIKLFIGDAREYIKTVDNIDIVYQDAFSSEVNYELWTVEYFKDIFSLCNEDALVTTYAIATPIRLSLYQAGFEIYEINPTGKRKQTLAFKCKQDIQAKYIDMELKQQRNTEAKALYDSINH